MPSANLYFSIPMFQKQLKRFWPLWSLYVLLHFLLLPMYMLMQSQNRFAAIEPLTNTFQSYLANMSTHGALWINFVFCILVAMAIWSYLYNNRSVSMIHALPLRRGTLFLTNYLTGLSFTIFPSVAVFLLTLGVEAFVGAVTLKALLLWVLAQILFSLFFFSFATLFAFVTGHILMLPLFYGIFSILTKGITMLLDGVFSTFVYGYSSGSISVLDGFGNWLAPIYTLQTKVRPLRAEVVEGVLTRQPLEVSGLGILAMYAAAGLVMTLLSYLLYRRRRLELAGEVVTVSFLQPVFKYGVAVCAGISFGMLFYQLFQRVFSQGIGTLLFFLLLWAAIGYYAAEMMLRKSFRVFRKGARGVVALLLLLTVVLLAVESDVAGYEKSVPELANVQGIVIYGMGASEFTKSEDIAAVITLHHALIKQKSEVEAQYKEYDRSLQEGREAYCNTHELLSIDIRYTLQDGRDFRRSYPLPISRETIEKNDSLAMQYELLMNQPEVRLKNLFPPSMREDNLTQVRINVPDYAKQAPGKSLLAGVSFEADPYGKDASMILSGEAAKQFYAAVREDIAAGRLGHIFLGSNYHPEYPKINCLNSIYFTFREDYNKMNTGGEANPYEYGYYRSYTEDNGKRVSYLEQNLDLQSTAISTIAVLEQCGLVRGVHILTLEQGEKAGYTTDEYGYDKYSYAPRAMTSDPAAQWEESAAVSP